MKLRHRTPVLIATTVAAGGIAVALGVAASQAASASSSGAAGARLAIAATAATPSEAPSGPGNDGDGHGYGGPGGPGGFGHGPGGPGGPGLHGQLLHGEEVVQQGSTVKTIDEQAGAVTAVSATSITVRSTDGFTATYVVTSSTVVDKDGTRASIASVKTGDTVRIEGEKKGSTVTATHIGDGKPPQRAWTPPTGPRPSGAPPAKPTPSQSS